MTNDTPSGGAKDAKGQDPVIADKPADAAADKAAETSAQKPGDGAVAAAPLVPPTTKPETHLAQESGVAARDLTAADADPSALGNLPAQPGTPPEPIVRGERAGMFGARNGADTSGYGGLRAPILFPAPAVRPYGSYFDAVVDSLESALARSAGSRAGVGGGGGVAFADAVTSVVVDRGELTLNVAREHLPAVVRVLRDDPQLRFEVLSGVSGVHYPADTGHELHVVYHFLSITHGSRRIRLEVSASESDPHVPSIVEIYPGANWHERETWDFFGVIFDGHPALTRILMPDDWPGHPQRKDYPLGGIPVEFKGATVPAPDERRSYN